MLDGSFERKSSNENKNTMENLTDTRFRKLGKPKNSFRFATSAAET